MKQVMLINSSKKLSFFSETVMAVQTKSTVLLGSLECVCRGDGIQRNNWEKEKVYNNA